MTDTTTEAVERLASHCDLLAREDAAPIHDGRCAATLRALAQERDALQPVGWIFFNPDTGTELSDQHPIDSGECPDATRIWPATAPTLAEFLKEAWETNRTTEAERDAARAEVERLTERVAWLEEIREGAGRALCAMDGIAPDELIADGGHVAWQLHVYQRARAALAAKENRDV